MIQPVSEQLLSVMNSPQDDIGAADAENYENVQSKPHW